MSTSAASELHTLQRQEPDAFRVRCIFCAERRTADGKCGDERLFRRTERLNERAERESRCLTEQQTSDARRVVKWCAHNAPRSQDKSYSFIVIRLVMSDKYDNVAWLLRHVEKRRFLQVCPVVVPHESTITHLITLAGCRAEISFMVFPWR